MNNRPWIEILVMPAGREPDWAAAESALRTNGQLADGAGLSDDEGSFDRDDVREAITIAREAIEDGTIEQVSVNGLTIYLTWEQAWECPDISICAALDLLNESGFAQIIGFAAQTDQPSPAAQRFADDDSATL